MDLQALKQREVKLVELEEVELGEVTQYGDESPQYDVDESPPHYGDGQPPAVTMSRAKQRSERRKRLERGWAQV